MTVTLKNSITLSGTYNKSFEGQTPSMPISFPATTSYTDGTLINQCDLFWSDYDRVLNATTEEIDLAGTLANAFADAQVFVKVCGIFIHNKMTTAGENLIIGGAAANAFLLFEDATDKRTIGPDGKFYVDEPSVAAIAVTAGTGDLLKLDAGATASLTFDIVIWGRSA